MKPLVSVIIPTYKRTKFLVKLLNNLITNNMNFKNFEIIICDSDKTKINFLIIKNSQFGPGYARNKAIEKSKHEWLAFLDSDDVWHDDKLLKVSNKLKKNKKVNCIIHNEIYINRQNKRIYYDYTNMFSNNKSIFKQLFSQNFLSPTSTCIKKSIVKKYKMFDTSLLNGQDYDLWLKMGNELKILKIHLYLAYYYERKENISSKPYLLRIKNILKIVNRYKKQVPKSAYFYKVIQLFISKEWFRI